MIERFEGDEGRRRLEEALARQAIVQGSAEVSAELAAAAELQALDRGAILVQQHASDDDLFFILNGEFSIVVNGREVARRRAEQHVGEMALVDPKSNRAATVIARDDSVVARIRESAFSAIAERHSFLWRNIACELAERLRQRNDLVRQRNEEPRVFIGSSKESLDVANAIEARLATRSAFDVKVWTQGVFGPSRYPLEALEAEAQRADFAILVLGPDDRVVSRRKKHLAPRDNVIFELGLFIGATERRRVFLALPQGIDVKIPTDLLGVTPVRYEHGAADLAASVHAGCEEIRRVIAELGPR